MHAISIFKISRFPLRFHDITWWMIRLSELYSQQHTRLHSSHFPKSSSPQYFLCMNNNINHINTIISEKMDGRSRIEKPANGKIDRYTSLDVHLWFGSNIALWQFSTQIRLARLRRTWDCADSGLTKPLLLLRSLKCYALLCPIATTGKEWTIWKIARKSCKLTRTESSNVLNTDASSQTVAK